MTDTKVRSAQKCMARPQMDESATGIHVKSADGKRYDHHADDARTTRTKTRAEDRRRDSGQTDAAMEEGQA